MNFSPYGVGVPLTAGLPVTTQYTTGKITQNVTTANGQVVGVLQGGENGVHYLRPLDANAFTSHSPPPNSQAQTVLTLPITMPGAKPGDPQQTVQIQVVNPIIHQQQHSPKFQISQIPIQAFGQGATVLTVAYNSNQEGIQIIDGQNGLPEGMTVVAALQPQDLQILQHQIEPDKITTKDLTLINIKTEMKDHSSMNNSGIGGSPNDQMDDDDGGQLSVATANYIQTTAVVQEYLQRMQNTTLPLSLQQFLKFNTDVKREHHITEDGLIVVEEGGEGEPSAIFAVTAELEEVPQLNAEDGTATEKVKKKKKYKKKPPKPKKPKPGQVHIATALDGTTLFCCPECHMAYPEKELLEQHLVGHKIERRFICDICGAGLKRKEHLERHKLGHNPERPFVCSVCMKGFKRKEHLNLHFVIHSGEKTEICGECGKGFYRKDHLRKHARSHITRRAKEQQQLLQQQQQQQQQQLQDNDTIRTIDIKQEPNATTTHVTIQVPSTQSQIQIPVQIQVPHHLQITAEGDDESCELLQIPVQIQVPQHHMLTSTDGDDGNTGGATDATHQDDHHVPNTSICYDPHLLQSCT